LYQEKAEAFLSGKPQTGFPEILKVQIGTYLSHKVTPVSHSEALISQTGTTISQLGNLFGSELEHSLIDGRISHFERTDCQ
jgi:hypothetical protein